MVHGFENQFEDFFYFFILLEDSFIIRYCEYDNNDNCYLNAQNCIPLILNVRGKPELRIREMKSARIIQQFNDIPKDFKYGTFHLHGKNAKITLHFKSGYYYTVYIKKKTIVT